MTTVLLAYSPMPSYDSFAALSSSLVFGIDEMLNNFQIHSPVSALFPALTEQPGVAAAPMAVTAAPQAKQEPKVTTTVAQRTSTASALSDVSAHHHHGSTSSAWHYHDVDPYGATCQAAIHFD
ncbi:hypothetical protein AMAG_16562 [Allomyces macrogynus ATCC 38327]|uniref:Uncharacterized protein n=1 Tax=Allomyces macrogynus (strain ATCC 38327) TaxID=578462 RepID=A0A0L0TCG7_ALLM3|nr:hypothetical protein AMAG_16562 [Allomyces macrogynus ATCC 38327]|eukprot:KNE72518.1 hypothetical protein AMAG_16562 [Allomyces macrogynus ATCC 38327]